MEVEILIEYTKTLIEYNQFALDSFQHVRETGEPGDFFQDVKPFADKVKLICDDWLPLAVRWIEIARPKNLHSIQLRNASENIQMVSVRAFYPETSLKKFNSHIQSVDFVLNRLLEELGLYQSYSH